jgi:hypothetical protein
VGTLIRHAGLRPAAAIGALPVPVVEFPFGALLMAEVCRTPLLAPCLASAAFTAVLMSTVTMPADPEHSTAMAAKLLTQNNFDFFSHPARRRDWTTAADNGSLKPYVLQSLNLRDCWQWAPAGCTTGVLSSQTFKKSLHETDDVCRACSPDDAAPLPGNAGVGDDCG